MQRAMSKIDACRISLWSRSRLSFGNIRRTLAQKKKQLAEAEALSMGGLNHDQVKILKGEVYNLMVKGDCMWHQQLWIDWLKSGDMNTNYFHSHTTQRNKRNFISKLVLEDGGILEDENSIGVAMVDYFKKIFTLASPSQFELILQGIEPKVTALMNVELTREFTVGKVEKTLKQMKALLALGPDGMSPIFYKSCWKFIGQDMIATSLSVLNSGLMPKNLNHTFISLIPKVKSPEIAKDFRSISLCNVLHKIISKTIANHLKKLLPKLVSESQSAFMSDGLISDNILVAFETLHHLQLDMSKAYDRVEWIFIEKVMEKLGFSGNWISLISSCIRSVSFSVLVNGEPHEHFTPNRGLSQGDLLSPYLFLLCVEG